VWAALTLLLALPARAQAPGWEAMVAAMAPALIACLAERPGAMVVEARWLGATRLSARLLLPGGARVACLAESVSGAVLGRAAVAEADRRPGEGLRAFMLERRCADAWRVTTPLGQELGWLAYPACG